MNRTRFLTTLAATALVGSGVAPAAATAADHTRAVETCSLRLVSTKAVNLQHDVEGTDAVRAQLGNTTGTARTYTLGQRRNTLGDVEETFSVSTRVSLQVEVLGGAWLTIDSRAITCDDQTRGLRLTNRDATYKARAVVEVLP